MATRPVVPRANGEGSIGTATKHWGAGHFDTLPNWQEYLAESTGFGIVSGCEPTISGLTVTVGAGIVHLADGTRKEISATNITLDSADPSNPRIDLVYIDSTGTVAKITGTAAASPVMPTLPTGGISVCNVAVAAGANTGTVNRVQTIAPNLANFGIVNVKDFGAMGDGVTDNTQALKNIFSQRQNKNKIIYFPSGRYVISERLTLVEPMVIMGEQSGATTIYCSAQDAGITMGGTSEDYWSGTVSNIAIKNISIKSQVTLVHTMPLLRCQYIGRMFMEDVAVESTGGEGMNLHCVQDSRFSNLIIRHCGNFSNDTYGIHLTSDDENVCSNNCFFEGLHLEHPNSSFIFIDSGCNNIIINNVKSEFYSSDIDITSTIAFFEVTSSEGVIFQNIYATNYLRVDAEVFRLKQSNRIIINNVNCNNTNISTDKFATIESCTAVCFNEVTGYNVGTITKDNSSYRIFYENVDTNFGGMYASQLSLIAPKNTIIGTYNPGECWPLENVVRLNMGNLKNSDEEGSKIFETKTDIAYDPFIYAYLNGIAVSKGITLFITARAHANTPTLTISVALNGGAETVMRRLTLSTTFTEYAVMIPASYIQSKATLKIYTEQANYLYYVKKIYYVNELIGSAIPNDRNWLKGESIKNDNPTAGSYVGWVCTAAGTPGTWKGFGLVES